MRHQTLTELEGLVKRFLVNMTNSSYAGNNKVSHNIEWVKGTAALLDDKGRKITRYYTLNYYLVDKNKSIAGERIVLYSNHYPVSGTSSPEKEEEFAYQEFLLNGVRQLYNVLISNYELVKDKEHTKVESITIDEHLEQLRASAETPKIIDNASGLYTG